MNITRRKLISRSLLSAALGVTTPVATLATPPARQIAQSGLPALTQLTQLTRYLQYNRLTGILTGVPMSTGIFNFTPAITPLQKLIARNFSRHIGH